MLAAIAAPLCAQAVQEDETDPDKREVTRLEEIAVQGEIAYRDRSVETAPVLSYDLEYFQRFEPLTVGDMLKRVPSVAFVSDVLEYDGAQLRGLESAYTQVLINGKRVPGAGDDRSFFVDRIPAELVERIEILRSTSANRSGDAIAGALNIVLREAYAFDGAYLRVGALYFDDGEFKETYGGVAGGDFAGGRLLAGFNVQGRYNPKIKQSLRFEEPGGDFVNREDQTDTRDGTDYSANLSFTRPLGAGELQLTGFVVNTDRTETENSLEYNDRNSSARDNLLSINDQVVDIDQTSYSVGAEYDFAAFGGDNELSLGFADFDDERFDTEEETGFDDEETPPSFDELEGERTLTDTDDAEFTARYSHERAITEAARLSFGLDYTDKERETSLSISEVDTDEEGAPLPPYLDFDRFDSTIEERRLDPWLMLAGDRGSLRWEAGVRYESTDVDVRFDGDTVDNDYGIVLPSVHLRWNLSPADRLRFSVARSVRRPDFNLLLPIELEGEFGDNDFVGNPLLDLESAWGIDLGFERRIGRSGVFGVNLFYRDVSDLIEVVNTGDPSSTALDDFEDEIEEFLDENPGATPATPGYPVFDPSSFLFTAANVGDGHVYGIEFDLSTPLTALGLPDTGVFANYSLLDSEVEDALGERRFNNQPRYVYNIGFIHDLPDAGIAFGASYRKQGDASFRVIAEEVETRYGADLEAFIEKRFGERVSVRLTASNLLDATKDEDFNKFDNLPDQIDRDFDEFELESEEAGPVVQLIARFAF